MTTLGIVLFAFGALLLLSVALNSWENTWHVLTGQGNSVTQLFKGSGTTTSTNGGIPKI